MKSIRSAVFGAGMLLACVIGATPANAQFWQCVPFARMISGIDIYGNAGTWWGKAAGRYDRGGKPKVGSVMVMKPHGKMRIGHVATVSRVVSDRVIKVTHANWSRRGRVEKDVRVVDVSPAGDWSQVKVWYAALRDVGSTRYPTFGFIYPKRSSVQFAEASGGAGMRGAALN
jgi:surface antigen